jgi:hypothetical protein
LSSKTDGKSNYASRCDKRAKIYADFTEDHCASDETD